MNSLSFKASAREIKCLIGFSITSIIQLSSRSWIFCLRKEKELKNLFISIDPVYASIFITSKTPRSFLSANFVEFLRKHLLNFEISDVIQKGAERIVTLILKQQRGKMEEVCRLIVEIMEKRSNIIVTDKNGKILESAKHIAKNIRKIAPNIMYTPPPSKELDLFTSPLSKLEKAYEEKRVKQILGWDAFLNDCVTSNKEFIELVRNIRCAFDNQNLQFRLYTNGKKYFIYPVELPYLCLKASPDILWEYYVEKPSQEVLRQEKERINKLIDRRVEKICKIREDVGKGIRECEQKEIYKKWGENLLSVPESSNRGLRNIQVIDIYTQKPINIPLKENKTLVENAQYYFKKYKKLSITKGNLEKKGKEIEKELEFFKQIKFDIENVHSVEELNSLKGLFRQDKRQKEVHPREVVEQLKIDGFTIFIGKNAIGNDIVTMDMANPADFWFHVRNYPGAHIIIRNEKKLKELPESIIMKAAKLAATHSANKNAYVDVDYTQKKYVRKPKGAKKGMVTYTHFHTIRVENVAP